MEWFIIIGIIVGMFGPLIWLLYMDYKLDKPYRDYYSGNIPKNLHCKTYKDYILYLYNNGKHF